MKTKRWLFFVLLMSCTICRTEENLIADQQLNWVLLKNGGADGALEKKDKAFRISKNTPGGRILVFNTRDYAITPGKNYVVRVEYSDCTPEFRPWLMVNFPTNKERRPFDLFGKAEQGVMECDFVAQAKDTAIRIHLVGGGDAPGVFTVTKVTVNEKAAYCPPDMFCRENFPPERLLKLRQTLPKTFVQAKHNLENTRKEWAGLSVTDRFANERVARRLDLVENLIQCGEKYLKAHDIDSVLFAERFACDLSIFENAFAREIELVKDHRSLPHKILSVRDFGAGGDGVTDDAAAFGNALDAAAKLTEDNQVTLLIPSGNYLFKTPREVQRGYLLLKDMRHLTLQGEDGTVLLGDRMEVNGIALAGCYDVTVKNITFRLIEKTFSQGTIKSVMPADSSFLYECDEGYAPPQAIGCGQVHHPRTGEIIKGATGKFPSKVEALGGTLYKISIGRAFNADKTYLLEPGQKFVIPFRTAGASAVILSNCSYCTLENVTVNHSKTSAFGVAKSSNCNFIRCRVIPVAGAMLSSNADGIHAWWSSGGLGSYVAECEFRNMGDDSFNAYNGGILIASVRDGRLIALGDAQKGDRLTIVSAEDGRTKAESVVKSCSKTEWKGYSAWEIALEDALPPNLLSYDELGSLPYSAHEKNLRNTGAKEYDREPDIIFNLSRSGIGTVLCRNDFRDNRNNSIVVQSAHSLMEGNRIARVGIGVRLGAFLTWKEGPGPANVICRDNVFTDCSAGIQSGYQLITRKNAQCRPLRDFRITNNHFRQGYNAISLDNVENIFLMGNTIDGENTISLGNTGHIQAIDNRKNGKLYPVMEFKHSRQTSLE